MLKRLKSNSDGGDSGNKKFSQALVAPTMGFGGVCAWREYGVRRSVLCCCIGFSLPAGVITLNLLHKYILQLLYFHDICKDSKAIHCITVQHKKGSLP
jgi:hypothetical protein